jgi:hypothetical protein
MKSFEDRLLTELVAAAYPAHPPRRFPGIPRTRRVALVAAATVGVAAAAAAGALDFWSGGAGDRPTGPLQPLVDRSPGRFAGSVVVDAYPASDGLCFRVREPDGAHGDSKACVDPDKAPFAGPDGLGIVTTQARAGGQIVAGLAPQAAVSVELVTDRGTVRTAARPLASTQPAAGRLNYFVAELPAGGTIRDVLARDADASVIARAHP